MRNGFGVRGVLPLLAHCSSDQRVSVRGREGTVAPPRVGAWSPASSDMSGKDYRATIKVLLSIEYEVDDQDSDLEKLGAEVIRAEADAFAAAVKRKLTEAGARVTSFHADYE